MKYFLLFVTCSLLSGLVIPSAQAQAPTGGGPTPQPTAEPTAVPLDGGTSLLLASGVGYGLRRLRQRRTRT